VSWYRNLRILLNPSKLSFILDAAIGDAPVATTSDDEKKVHQMKKDDFDLV
jgi:hypothetical protein